MAGFEPATLGFMRPIKNNHYNIIKNSLLLLKSILIQKKDIILKEVGIIFFNSWYFIIVYYIP